ncbi:MAG: RNA polymerase sigma factor [bacterium]|nr:RNA polymerase sigma factor [bacterium]
MNNVKQQILSNAFLSLAYHDYEKALNSYAYFKVSDHSLGEDLVQDTFMKMWNYLQKGGEVLQMKSFLYHILNNLIIDNYRKNKSFSLDLLLDNGYEPNINNDDSEKMLDFLDGESAIKLIRKLPKKYIKIMQMKYEKNLSLSEISKLTLTSNSTAAVQLHRGLDKLKILYMNRTKQP